MGFVDIHSHILPGLDDGSKSMEQSLEMLKIARQEGIHAIIATTHNMPGKGCPTGDVLKEALKQLRTEARAAGVDIDIYLGTEYYYREEVRELFEQQKAVTMSDSKYVLLEFHPAEDKTYIYNAVRDTYSSGYTPIIAHVERYEQLMKKTEYVKKLRDMGALIQINASSVIGGNGYHTKREVKRLLRERLVDFVSTDAHSDRHRSPRMEKCAAYLYKKFDSDYADRLLYKNAEKYLI